MEDRDTGKKAASGPDALRKRWWIVFVVVCLLIAAAYVFVIRPGMAQSQAKKRQNSRERVVPVSATPARKGDMGVYVNGLGTVTPVSTVTVRTRVDGQLMGIHYKEGQTVKKGDPVAQIDPRPYEVLLAQAEGQFARDRALLANARVDLDRYRALWKQDSVSKQQLDTQESLVRQYEGTVKADQAQIDSARLQLTYCRIIAPISGRIGLRLVDPGNMVHASDTSGLIVITQVQPISVVFPIPEGNLSEVLKRFRAGHRLRVEAYDREQKERLAVGHLLTVDNRIDTTTGTVKLKAVFPNTHDELFPNQFVNARLLVDTRRGVTVVPSAAVQRGPQGTYVYVVKDDGTAAVRAVGVGEIQGDEALITRGISPGDVVVTDGAERLREGSKVQAVKSGKPGASRKDS